MAATLYDYYTSQGKALPSVSERAVLASQNGINNYTGTAEQNTALLTKLQAPAPAPVAGATTGSPVSVLPNNNRSLISQTPQAGYIKGYDTDNNYAPVYVPNGKYVPGISPTPKQITTDSLQSAGGIKLPGAQGSTSNEADALVAGASTSIADLIKQLTPEQTQAEGMQQDILKQIAGLTAEQGNLGTDTLAAEQQAGIPELRKQISDINGQIQTKLAEYNVLQTANQNKPITMDSIIGNERAILNAKAADIGLLEARANALNGNLEVAQQNVDRAIGLKYQTIESRLNTYQAQLNALLPTLNKEEKIQAQAQQLLIEQEKQKVADKKDQEQKIQNVMLQAVEAGITDQNVLNKISNAKSIDTAISILSQGMPDQNVAQIMSKYPDAGITIKDSLAVAQAKLKNSRIYQDQVRGPVGSGGGGASGPLGLSNQQIDNISPLVTQFQNSDIVKNYNTIGEGYNFVNSLSNSSTNPADDQALIYALAKALDPGSVVREGEYATVQKYAQSLAKSYGKSFTQALSGTGFLSQDARKNIKETIKSRFKTAEASYNNLYGETERRINLIGATNKGKDLLNNYGGAFTPANAPQPPAETQSEIPAGQKSFWSKATNWLFGD